MTQSIALINNDIGLDQFGNLGFVAGINAVMQNCQTAMLAQMGEMMYAMSSGMPTLQTAWNNYNPRQFESAARAVLMAVYGVTSVQSFSAQLSNNVLTYGATIQTIYGVTQING